MNAYEKLDARPCFKCPDRRVLCHATCERYKAYRADLDAYNAEQKRLAAGDPAPRHWKKLFGKWVKVK